MPKITWQRKIRSNLKKKKIQETESNPEMIQMLELAGKDFKADIRTTLHDIKEIHIHIMNMCL